jgi:hypothetical protein
MFFDPLIGDPGWKKKSGSGMNIPDHISESLETIFRVENRIRIRDLFYPGSGIEKFGSVINIPDPQRCVIIIENWQVIFNVISMCHVIQVHTRYYSKTLFFTESFTHIPFWGKSGK